MDLIDGVCASKENTLVSGCFSDLQMPSQLDEDRITLAGKLLK